MGIFLNYSMSARARKGYLKLAKASSNLEESLSQALSSGIYDAYVIDQMIAKNTSTAVQDYLGYFIVKDIPENHGATVTQNTAEKIWEEATGDQNTGPWYIVNSSNYSKSPVLKTVKMSKGGYFIKSIKNMANNTVIYEANDNGTAKAGYTGNPIQKELENYYSGKPTIYPKFEVVFYKNILMETEDGRAVRNYDAIVTITLNYKPMDTSPTVIESRTPFPMLNGIVPSNPVIDAGTEESNPPVTEILTSSFNSTITEVTDFSNPSITYDVNPVSTSSNNNVSTCNPGVVLEARSPSSGSRTESAPSSSTYAYYSDLASLDVTEQKVIEDGKEYLITTRIETTPYARITKRTDFENWKKTETTCSVAGNHYKKDVDVYNGEKITKLTQIINILNQKKSNDCYKD